MRELQVIVPWHEHAAALNSFFALLQSSGDDRFFHPHELTETVARRICDYEGEDFYCAMLHFEEVVAYGMLRGWDEGYKVPSLGIAVSPALRGTGAAKAMMGFLHVFAKLRHSDTVMLKVYKENLRARSLFESFGYRFEDYSEDMLKGTVVF